MLLLCLFLLFVIVPFNHRCYVQAQETVYRCYASSDPHIFTWHEQNSGFTLDKYQDCYAAGWFPLVKNEFLHYKVKISQRWMVDMELYFYNGTSKRPVCLVVSEDFEMHADDEIKCREYGITWHLASVLTHFVMSISYSKANFYTTVQFDFISRSYAPHYNIYTWQPDSLTTRSTGVCQMHDTDCRMTIQKTGLELEDENIRPQGKTITNSEAQVICQTHVNAYLGKTRRAPDQRSASINNTIASVLAGCEADVMFTGHPEAARSDVSVLMINELINDATSINSIQTAIESSVAEAIVILDQAAAEAESALSRLLPGIMHRNAIDTNK